jgi:hypothetical protein
MLVRIGFGFATAGTSSLRLSSSVFANAANPHDQCLFDARRTDRS